jgi:hypothetical protein
MNLLIAIEFEIIIIIGMIYHGNTAVNTYATWKNFRDLFKDKRVALSSCPRK